MFATSPRRQLVRPIVNGRSKLTDVELLEAKGQLAELSERCLPFSTVGVYCVLACMFFLALPARASFIGVYSLANFTLINSDLTGGTSGTDGFAMSPDGGLSVVLTGGNSGSGLAGTTDLVINATAAGLVQFQYSSASADSPGFDFSGYLLAGNFFPPSDSNGMCNAAPCPGMAHFTVSVGQSFGFRVGTMDNQDAPSILSISNFSAPGNDTPLPHARKRSGDGVSVCCVQCGPNYVRPYLAHAFRSESFHHLPIFDSDRFAATPLKQSSPVISGANNKSRANTDVS